MNCPHCDHPESRVSETKPGESCDHRVRICRKCGKTFRTIERIGVYAGRKKGWIEDSTPEEEEVPPEPKPKKQLAFVANPEDPKLQTFEPEIRHDICTWWNESRKSKHGAKAAWTERAFLGSVYRLAALPSWKQMVLVKAGIEHGWQTLQEEYVKDILDKHKPYRPGLQPKSTAMQKALEQWNPS